MPPFVCSAPHLLARASGRDCVGPHRCLFCGAPAESPYSLPDSFTTRDNLRRPGSAFACAGCLLALEEVGEATYPDGTRYKFTKAFRRMCSHVVTRGSVVMATKGHLDYLRNVCLSPPSPPFVISLAVSGQKHVLYRGVVCRSRESVSVTLEGERVDYRPDQLRDRLTLCAKLAAATGKPALSESPTPSFWFRVCERYNDGEAMCELWDRVREEPLSRLASFLCPPKEVCSRDHPGTGPDGVPPTRGGSDRPQPKADRGRRK